MMIVAKLFILIFTTFKGRAPTIKKIDVGQVATFKSQCSQILCMRIASQAPKRKKQRKKNNKKEPFQVTKTYPCIA